MKSRVITFCVFYICSGLVASIPYPEELASLLRAYSASGAPSNNDFSNPLELPNVARSHNYGSLREISGPRSFKQGNGDFDYNPLEISSLSRPQSQGSSSTLNNLYDRSRIQQRNNDYGKYIQQSQPSFSDLTLQRELEKQQQAALQNHLANQFIQSGGLDKLISNRDISSEISPPQIRRVSDSYVDSLPLETLLQQAKRIETVPIRSPLIQKTLPVLNNQPSLLDKLQPSHLNTRKSVSQGYENIKAVDPIVFGKQQYLQVPQGTGKKPVIDDARIKEILDEVEIAKKIGNSGYRDIAIGSVNNKEAKTGVEKVLSQSKATAQAFATTSKEGGNQKQPPGSLTEIFSHLNLNQNKPGPIPEILNGSVSTTKPSKNVETKPKENNQKKKRYMIIYPNGTREYVNTIDRFVTNNSNYVFYTNKNVTQGLKAGHIPANNPYVLHNEGSTNANSKATVAPISKNVNAGTKKITLPATSIKTASAVAVATNSELPTKKKLSPNGKIVNKVVLDGNLKKNTAVPKTVPVKSTPSRSVPVVAAAAATATAAVLPGKSVGLGSKQTVKPIIKPQNPLSTSQSFAKASVTLPYQKKLPHDTIEEISKPKTTKPTNTTNNPQCDSTSTTSTTTTPMPSTTTTECTTDEETTTSKPYRVDHKKPKLPVWFETDLNDSEEDLVDKLTEGGDIHGSVYVFQIPVRPIIDRDTKTTIYPNGTIVEETVEAVCDDDQDKPKFVRTTTIVHPKHKRNLGKEENHKKYYNNSDKEYNNKAYDEDIDEEDTDSVKEDKNFEKEDIDSVKEDRNYEKEDIDRVKEDKNYEKEDVDVDGNEDDEDNDNKSDTSY